MSSSEQTTLCKTAEKNRQKMVCRHCKLVFYGAKALGGHIKVHNKYRRKTDFTPRRRNYKRKTQGNSTNHQIVDLSNSSSGFSWKFKKMRGSNSEKTTKSVANDYEGDDEYEYEHDEDADVDEDEDEDEDDDDGFTVMDRLRVYGVGDNTHQISRTKKLYVCKTCDLCLPTFHAVLVHVNDNSGFSGSDGSVEVDVQDVNVGSTKDVEGDHEEDGAREKDKVVMGAKASTQVNEEVVAGNCGSVDQIVSNSNPPKMLDFDLNELPPNED